MLSFKQYLNEKKMKNPDPDTEMKEAGPNPTGGASNATSGRRPDGSMKVTTKRTPNKSGIGFKSVSTQDFRSGNKKLKPVGLSVKF